MSTAGYDNVIRERRRFFSCWPSSPAGGALGSDIPQHNLGKIEKTNVYRSARSIISATLQKTLRKRRQ